MDNLHYAIAHLFDDFIQPKAKGVAWEGLPDLWEEEAQMDDNILRERLMKRLAPGWQEPYVLRREKKAEPKQKDGFEIDEKALAKILMGFDESLVVRLKAQEYNIQDVRPEVYALVYLAAASGWEKIHEGQDIYMIR